jgi:hypothetical protein
VQEHEPSTKAAAALVSDLRPLLCPALIHGGSWSEDAFFAASHDRERGEATLWRWDRLDAPPRPLAVLAGEIHGIAPSPDGTALVLTNYHAARPDRHHAPSDHAELVHLDLRSERWRRLALDGSPDPLLLPCRPSWSADGARVAFTAMIRPYGKRPAHVTAVVDVASARLVDVPAPPPPDRSPDGKIALDLRGGRLHLHGADARHTVSLADHPGTRRWRATLPDTWLGGHRLVFPAEENTVVLDLTTGHLQALARVIVRWVAPSRWRDVAVIGHREGPSWAEVRPDSPA